MTRHIITGANRGFGWALARKVLHKAPENDIYLLCSKLESALALCTRLGEDHPQAARCSVHVLDFGQPRVDWQELRPTESQGIHISYWSTIDDFVAALAFETSDPWVLYNNAGTLGPLVRIADQEGSASHQQHLQAYFTLNVVSPIHLSKRLLDRAAQHSAPVTIVNVSSLAAIQPFDGWAWYCTAKAAREMYFSTLALETKHDARVRVLNYAPGPMDTDMQQRIREEMSDGEVRRTFIAMKEAGTLVDPLASAAALLQVLDRNAYANGAHIDYYDLHPA
ncbi:hypothetical protein HDU91_001949, partial [Kappamyces sp. JEL0680]